MPSLLINIIRSLPFITTIILFIFFFGSYVWRRKISSRILKWGTITVISLVFFRSAFLSVFQYNMWSKGELSKFFLPPYQSINYFLGYAWQQYWFSFVIVLSFSLLLAAFFYVVNDYFKHHLKKGIIFKKEDFWLAIFCAFLVMWPGFLLFVILSFLLGFFEKSIFALIHPIRDRSVDPCDFNWYFPFLISALIVLVDGLFWGSYLINLLNLDLLHV